MDCPPGPLDVASRIHFRFRRLKLKTALRFLRHLWHMDEASVLDKFWLGAQEHKDPILDILTDAEFDGEVMDCISYTAIRDVQADWE